MTLPNPIEVSFRGVRKTDSIEQSVHELVRRKLEPVCDHMQRCEVAIERPHAHPRSGSGYRVRIHIYVPPSHTIVAVREPNEGLVTDNLLTVLQSAFGAARKQLKKVTEQQQGKVKVHEGQRVTAVVRELKADHGVLETENGELLTFEPTAVVGDGFDALRVGMGVAYTTQSSAVDLRVSTVRVVDGRPAPAEEPPPPSAEV